MSRLTTNVFKTIALVLGVAGCVHATDVGYSGTFQGTEGAAKVTGGATPKTFTRDMNTTGDRISMQIVYSTYTVASSTFSSLSYALNTPTITVTNNGFTTGLQVLYSTGTAAIAGLTNQTTYFISVISANTLGKSNTFELSSSSANAIAGTGIVLASSSTASNQYTLAPLPFTNTTGGGIQLQYSDDNATYFNATTSNWAISISSLTFATAGGTALYDLGPIQHRYLRLNVVQPTQGAVTYTATDNERYSFKH